MEKKNGAAQSLAMLVCAIMIFSAVCIGGYRYVASERANVLEYYVSGDGTQQDLGIRYLLEKRIGESEYLMTLRQDTSRRPTRICRRGDAVAALENEDNPNKAYTYNNTLTRSCDTLTAKLSGYALSEKDAQYLSEIKRT
jgi:hypothetical protein